MNVFLVRHAIAEPFTQGQADAHRALTPRGRDRFSAQVRGMARLDLRFSGIFTSPSLRALQTAELLSPLCDAPPQPTPLLAQAPARALLVLLASQGEGPTALVGHEPWLGALGALLLTGDPDGCELQLKKGAVVHLQGELEQGTMCLQALWPPRTLRRLGR